MVKASRISSEDFLSTLKALFPIFAGILFLLLIIYIFSIYEYQKDLNTYFVLNEERNSLEEEYLSRYKELLSGLESIKGKKDRISYLEGLGESNSSLVQIVDQMIIGGYKMLELNIRENESLDLAINEMNVERLKLHSQISEYISKQSFAAKYIGLKNETEACYNKIDLEANNYSKIVTQLQNCSEILSKQIELITSSDIASNSFSKTSSYLSKYENYWETVRQMYSYLAGKKVKEAKKLSSDVTKQLKKLPEAQRASENELNMSLSETVVTQVNDTVNEVVKKGNEVMKVRESTSF